MDEQYAHRNLLRLTPLSNILPDAEPAVAVTAKRAGQGITSSAIPGTMTSMTIREHVPLAPHCTLGVGGPARFFVEAADEATVLRALEWATARRVPFRALGGGSNLVVADDGVDACVVKIGLRGIATRETAGGVEVTAAAGEPWDQLVASTVARGWAGLECLSGIPGLVGATPIQNVGAYGQEVSETLVALRALDTSSGRVVTLAAEECGFAYRDSRFKRDEPGRHAILSATYRLAAGAAPRVRYAEVERHLASRGIRAPSLAEVRDSVLAIRRSKSMVIEAGDENRRSCGSFFTNAVVAAADAERVAAIAGEAEIPRWPQPDGRVKLSSAWLIERAGFRRGHREGLVGLSTRHALAVVAHDGARAADVVAFAARVTAAVHARFGVRLTPEPVYWGFDA
jgi:UDP-N-acetylmuramate dehydrogenase